jgi:hypothetical protein
MRSTALLLGSFTSASALALTVTGTQTMLFPRGFAGDGALTLAATAPTAGAITLTGTPNARVNLAFPATVNVTNGASTLAVDTFSSSPNNFRLSAAGTGTVTVGGRRAAIPTNALPGTYSGSVAVTLTEQGTGNTTVAVVSIQAPVWRQLAVTKVRDLTFGLGMVGDGPKTVPPSDPNAGVVDVEGQPSATFTATIPATVTLNCGGCGGSTAQRQLSVSLTQAPGNPVSLGTVGEVELRFGGTREAITTGKRQGLYSGSFTVTVAYN